MRFAVAGLVLVACCAAAPVYAQYEEPNITLSWADPACRRPSAGDDGESV